MSKPFCVIGTLGEQYAELHTDNRDVAEYVAETLARRTGGTFGVWQGSTLLNNVSTNLSLCTGTDATQFG